MAMKLPELGKRGIAIIYAFVLLVSGVLLYIFVVSPELGRYRMAVDRYNSQQQREMRETTRRDDLLEEYQVLREKADNVKKLIFTKRQAEEFMEMLPKLSKRTGNILHSMAPQDSRALAKPPPKDPKQEDQELPPLAEIAQIPIPLSITGTYSNMIKLFEELEDTKELMAITNVGVGSRGGGEKVGVSFSLNLLHTKSEIKAPSDELLAKISGITQTEVAEAPEASESEPPGLVDETEVAQATIMPRVEAAVTRSQLVNKGVRDRYAVQVGAFNVEENSKELAGLLRSRSYEPWVRPNLVTGQAPHHVLVGKFDTKAEADQFGKLMKEELPWVDEYIVKRAILDYDTVLSGTRVEE